MLIALTGTLQMLDVITDKAPSQTLYIKADKGSWSRNCRSVGRYFHSFIELKIRSLKTKTMINTIHYNKKGDGLKLYLEVIHQSILISFGRETIQAF